MTYSRADTGELIRRDARAHAASTNQDPAVGIPSAHGLGNRTGIVRVVHGCAAEGSHIEENVTGLR
jgi:hypothetical protein